MGLIDINNASYFNGIPENMRRNATLSIYTSGSETLVPLFADPGLTFSQANPVRSDASGTFQLCYLTDGVYRFTLMSAQGETLQDLDNIRVTASTQQGFLQGFESGQDVLADQQMSYTQAAGKQSVVSGDTLFAVEGAVSYRVADPSATDHHLETRGGVKLYVTTGDLGHGVFTRDIALTGEQDDTEALQRFLDGHGKLQTSCAGEAHISATIDAPSSAHWVDLQSLTITQRDNADLSKLISHRGFGNTFGKFCVRVNGNRVQNSQSVTGCQLDATTAGDSTQIDVSGVDCDVLLRAVKEVEHCQIQASGRNCGAIFEIDTTTNTSDENNITIYGYQSDTLFRTVGDNKSSGKVDVFGEVLDSWAIDLENGWYSIGGVVRSCGSSSGGGCKITSTTASRIHFRGLQLYGLTPAPNNGTWGLLVDSATAWLDGDLILGVFDGGAWIKQCKEGSCLRLSLSGAASVSDALRLGEASTGKAVDGARFDLSATAAAGHVLNLDMVRNSSLCLRSALSGNQPDIRISAHSYDNTIEIGRSIALQPSILNERPECDNLIIFKGSYTYSDLSSLNGGVYFPGMRVEELRLEGGLRSPAYFDSDVMDWIPTSPLLDEKSASALADAENQINAIGKYKGKIVWDVSNRRAMRARNSSPTSPWDDMTGEISIPPT